MHKKGLSKKYQYILVFTKSTKMEKLTVKSLHNEKKKSGVALTKLSLTLHYTQKKIYRRTKKNLVKTTKVLLF